MPVVRFVNDRNRDSSQLRRILAYAKRDGRVSEQHMTGVGINPDTAFEEMMTAKRMFHQEAGKQYVHLVISCDRMMRQPDAVHQIGKEISRFYKDYQVLVTTHTDTDNLHCHLVINTVNMVTGRKLSQRRKDFWRFLEFANMVFGRHNMPSIGSEQMYEVLLEDTDFWEDDLDEFDEIIHGRLEDLQRQCKVQRPIFFEDAKQERADILRSIERMEQEMRLEGEV